MVYPSPIRKKIIGKKLQDTSRTFVKELQQDGAVAWGIFDRVYTPYIRAMLKGLGVAVSDIDDVAQDVLVTVAKGVKSLELRHRTGSFRAWLKTIARSRAIDHMRLRNRRVNELNLELINELDLLEQNPDDEEIEQNAVVELYARATAELSNYFRKESVAIFLTLVKGASVSAIAIETGKSEAAIRQIKVRVLHRLREIAGE